MSGRSLSRLPSAPTLGPRVPGVVGGSGPARGSSPILASTITATSPVSSASPTTSIGGTLGLVLAVERWEGFVEALGHLESCYGHLLARLEKFVCGLEN